MDNKGSVQTQALNMQQEARHGKYNLPQGEVQGMDLSSGGGSPATGSGSQVSQSPQEAQQHSTVQPTEGSATRETVSPITIPLDYQYNEKEMMGNISQAISSDIADMTERELLGDQTFSYASKTLYRKMTGDDFRGSDEEANQYGIDLMRKVDNILLSPSQESLLGFEQAVSTFSPEEAKTALYMMEMFEAKDFTGRGVAEALGYMGQDPSTYLGITSLGWGFAGKQAAKLAAKKTMLKKLHSIAFSGASATSVEGAGYSAATEDAKQGIKESAGQNYDKDAVAASALIGAGVGAAAGVAIPAAANKIGDMIKGD